MIFFDHQQRRQRCSHRQVILTEGVRMDDATFHGVEYAVHDPGPRYHRADWNIAAGKGFRYADDVGLDFWPVLIAEPFAGPPESRLDFVDHQQGPELAAEALGFSEVAVLHHLARFPLDWLEDERGRLLQSELALQ